MSEATAFKATIIELEEIEHLVGKVKFAVYHRRMSADDVRDAIEQTGEIRKSVDYLLGEMIADLRERLA